MKHIFQYKYKHILGGLFRHKMLFNLLMGAVFVGASLNPIDVQAAICGRIQSLRGQTEVLRLKSDSTAMPSQSESQTRQALLGQKKMKLWCSDIVITRQSARAKIQLKNQSLVTLAPESRLEIKDYLNKKDSDPSQLKLIYGKVRAFVEPVKLQGKLPKKGAQIGSPKQTRFIIKTPSAVAGVRGTDFFVSHNMVEDKTEQATLTGTVEVEQVQTGLKVLVQPGKQVEVKPLKEAVAQEIKKAVKEGKDAQEILKDVATKEKDIKIMTVEEIAPETKEVIRQTSAIAKADKNFASDGAEKILGKASTWKLPPEEAPFSLDELKEEY